MTLKFNPETHEYTYNGNWVPGVTESLGLLSSYTGVNKEVLSKAAERGKIVHKACELLSWGRLDESKVPQELEGYIEAYKRFVEDFEVKPLAIECRVFHKYLEYAGAIDQVDMIKIRKRDVKAIIDIKTTAQLMPTCGPQIAAYREAYNSDKKVKQRINHGYALLLSDDGKYKLEKCGSNEDFNIFISCLNVFRFLKANNIQADNFGLPLS